MYYLIIILSCMLGISLVDYFFVSLLQGIGFFEILLGVTITTVAVIFIDAIFALIIRRCLPSKWFGVDKEWFKAGRRESKFYEKLGIKIWKDKVLELGAFTGFRKNKIVSPNDNLYVGRYIIEANYGVLIHLVDVLVGFLVICIFPVKVWFCFGFPVAIVNAFLNWLPLMVLRYNLKKLHVLYRINKKRAENSNKKQQS